jgi:AP-1 complex subunit beta-1
LQTVAAGQVAENLLDFEDTPGPSSDAAPSGLAATTVVPAASTAAAASLLAGTSSNPLDDLVSIFGSVGAGATPQPSSSMGAFDFGGPGSGMTSPVAGAPPSQLFAGLGSMGSPPPQQQTQQPQDDLLGLF